MIHAFSLLAGETEWTPHAELESFVSQYEKKYFDLVWFARKPQLRDLDAFEEYFLNHDGTKTPPEVQLKCKQQMIRIQEAYPDEVESLQSALDGDWDHGFNSGMLAGLRLVLTAMKKVKAGPEASDTGEECWFGGIEEAAEEFPMLDT